MADLFSPIHASQDLDVPKILAIALKISQLVFPDLVYAGKIVSESDDIDDCELCLFARNTEGEAQPQARINLEIIKVGQQRSITAEYPEQISSPILWYGQHAVWMDGETGQSVPSPANGVGLERLARGILKRLEDENPT